MARPRSKSSRADRPRSPRPPAQAESEIPEPYREFLDLGRRVDQLIHDKRLSERAAGAEIATQLGVAYATAMNAHRVLKQLTPADLRRLATIRDGKPVSNKHLACLARVPDPAMRQQLIDELGVQKWTTDDLQAIIRQRKGTAAKRTGRPVRKPVSRADGLLQIRRRTRAWLQSATAWGPAQDDDAWIHKQEPVVTEDERKSVVEELRELAEAANALADRLEQLRLEGPIQASEPGTGEPPAGKSRRRR